VTAKRKVSVGQEQVELFDKLARGRHDIEYFFREILGIDPNPAQRRWFRLIRPGENGWEWRLKLVLHVAANQIGKTLGLGGLILWACNYKIGVPTENEAEWLERTFPWFHLAPTQQQAYLTRNDMAAILKGSHPAQRRPCMLPTGFVREVKIEQYYDGFAFWNGATVQFRTMEEKAKAILGRRAAGISVDEGAFEDHLKVVVNEVLLMRLISTGGPLWVVSTPNGINDFYEMVQAAIDVSEQIGERLWESEGNQTGVLWSIVTDNEGYGLTTADIARMERDLDESTKEQQLRGAFLEPSEAFFVPGPEVIKAWSKKLEPEELPIPGHRYVIFWDPSVASDPTAVVVLDATMEPWRGVFFKHYLKAPNVQRLIHDIYALHALYSGARDHVGRRSTAITGFDSTSMGGAMLRQQLTGLSPSRPINLAGPKAKLDLLTDLRAALLKRKVVVPASWVRVQREVLNYRLEDKKLVQDTVIALAGAVHLAARGFSGASRARFQPSGRVTTVRTHA
jgi:hypothetical protein